MILVTGGYGCIGAELVKWLLRNTSEQVVLGSRTVNAERTDRMFHDVDCANLHCIKLDISNPLRLQEIFERYNITHIAHLAALQTPDCNAYKDLGMQINLGGTQKILETVKQCGAERLQRLVFASSIAVYGPRASYSTPRVPTTARPNPVNVYGVWKLASEQILQLFAHEVGVSTVCLRPGVLFGPGRDLGLTSTPTTAMKAMALKAAYKIPFCSKQDYLYSPDVGAAFGQTLLEPFTGFGIFTLPATTLAMPEVVDTLKTAAAQVGLSDGFNITFGDSEVPFICDLEYEAVLQAFPNIPKTDFQQAVMESLTTFQAHVENGWITSDDLK